ncbi:hypothetical protein BT69DRAFT_793667, partial [Atractiella rhizophila]
LHHHDHRHRNHSHRRSHRYREDFLVQGFWLQGLHYRDLWQRLYWILLFPCNSAPTVSFSFSGKAWAMSADTFSLGQVSSGSSSCVGSIVGEDLGLNAWIVGDSFLRNVYSVYDYTNERVGFATPK